METKKMTRDELVKKLVELHDFVLESFDDGMGDEIENPLAFIASAVEVMQDNTDIASEE